MPFDGAKLGSVIVLMVREFVARQLDGVSQKTAQLSDRIAVLEQRAPVAGPVGERGEKGEKGEKGDKGDAGDQGPQGTAGERGEAGQAGRDGVDGKDGERGPQGEPGRDGKDGIPGPQGEKGLDGRDGKDGVSISSEDVRAIVIPEVCHRLSKEVDAWREQTDKYLQENKPQDGRDGAPGRDGRDAVQIEPLPAIDETKSYSRGTYAEHRGGTIRAFRNTDPITDSLEKAGWVVCMNGVAEEAETMLDDCRTIQRETVYTNGQRFSRQYKTAALQYRGVWREGEYDHGDMVTWAGSMFHCERKTTDKPETSDAWRLCVKRGQDGKK